MSELKDVLMQRDNLTSAEADEQITEATAALNELLAAESTEEAHNICADMFGLEPDYLFDLME
jgi:hypothetical protein